MSSGPDETLAAVARRAAGRIAAERGLPGAVPPPPGVHVGAAAPPSTTSGSTPRSRPGTRALISRSSIGSAGPGSASGIASDALWTPLAEEDAYLGGATRVRVQGSETTVAVASDHGGRELRGEVLESLRELGWTPRDLGSHDSGASDYPSSAAAVAEEVASGRASLGVVLDAMGTGSAIAANKVRGVRAANAWDEASAASAREHNHANVLALGASHLDRSAVHRILEVFLRTEPGEGRHARRVGLISALERRTMRSGEVRA